MMRIVLASPEYFGVNVEYGLRRWIWRRVWWTGKKKTHNQEVVNNASAALGWIYEQSQKYGSSGQNETGDDHDCGYSWCWTTRDAEFALIRFAIGNVVMINETLLIVASRMCPI